MKKLIYFLSLALIVLSYSCNDDDDDFQYGIVTIQLEYPSDAKAGAQAGVTVTLTYGEDTYTVETNESGLATFQIPYGTYEATVTDDRVIDDVYSYKYTGTTSNIAVNSSAVSASVELTEAYLGRTDSKMEVTFQLVYPSTGNYFATADVAVALYNDDESLEESTSSDGTVTFAVSPGTYEASVTDKRYNEGFAYTYSATKSDLVFSESWDSETAVDLELTESITGQIIIKELYISGCQKDDGSGSYTNDQYVILYNNSNQTATLDNLCLGTVSPYNSNATSKYLVDGVLNYISEGWVPATSGIPYTQSAISLEPGGEMVIALCGAIDHTLTYSNSVNLVNSEYYVLYDYNEQLTHSKYVAPDASIPTSQYLGIQKWSSGSGWTMSNSSPAFFVFTTKNSTPEAFGTSTDNYTDEEGTRSKKLDTEWILDGIDVFRAGYENTKRFGDDVDAGSISLTGKIGYTLYRNVDQEATEALTENADLLVYNYAYGTLVDGVSSTDPSEIDAEASIANGAIIIYVDTNNSTNDFHQRSQASLRD